MPPCQSMPWNKNCIGQTEYYMSIILVLCGRNTFLGMKYYTHQSSPSSDRSKDLLRWHIFSFLTLCWNSTIGTNGELLLNISKVDMLFAILSLMLWEFFMKSLYLMWIRQIVSIILVWCWRKPFWFLRDEIHTQTNLCPVRIDQRDLLYWLISSFWPWCVEIVRLARMLSWLPVVNSIKSYQADKVLPLFPL
jgi:hypothetical protein